METETETLQQPTVISIFDPRVTLNRERKGLVGFQGSQCHVRLSLGGIQFDCYDHRISCFLRHATIHEVSLFVEPWEGVTEWSVQLQWTTQANRPAPVMDETLQEILTFPCYSLGMIGVPTDMTKINEKNNMRKIITELSNKAFLEDRRQESTVLAILEEHYKNMKLY